MKRFLAVGFLVVLAAVTALTWSASVSDAARMRTIPVKWAGGADTTFMESEADTTRTMMIELSDLDLPFFSTTASDNWIGLAFVVTGGADNLVSDSLYYTIEKTWDGVNFEHNGTIVAGEGTVATARTKSGAGGTTFVGSLIMSPVAYNVNAINGCKAFRLRVHGDIDGATPKLSGLKCFITYPTLFDY